MSATSGAFVRGYVVPGHPHPLLAPETARPWAALRQAFEEVRREIEATDADLLLLYSTQWISIIGHQMQADPRPVWTLVDPEWHDLGDMPYEFEMDVEFARAYREKAEARGLKARTVAYHGFPIDTGSVVALKLLNPENRIPAGIVSCNMYADRAETLVLGKAAHDAVVATGRKALAIAVTSLSNRMFTTPIDPAADHVSAEKDDEWNRKILEILGEGRLEDVSQLARQFTREAHADQKMKAVWWLAAALGQHNRYEGHVFTYQPVWGTGAAVVGLTPSARASANLEFDEEDVDVFVGDRDVLSGTDSGAPSNLPGAPLEGGTDSSRAVIHAAEAPRPVGAFPHARRVGDLLFLSGMGPRTPGTDEIPGGPVRDEGGNRLEYDVEAQTRAVIENVRTVLESSGSSLDRVMDVTCFLIDMERDFEAFNRVYGEYFADVGATRTTVAIDALPTPIAVEFKVIAAAI